MVFCGELAERLVSHFLLQSQAALIVIPISHCTGDGSFAYHRQETEQTDCLIFRKVPEIVAFRLDHVSESKGVRQKQIPLQHAKPLGVRRVAGESSYFGYG